MEVLCQMCRLNIRKKASSQFEFSWFASHLYVCVCVCGVRACMQTCMWIATNGVWMKEHENWNRRTVCHLSVHPRTLSYKAREAYVLVVRLSLCLCLSVCIYIPTFAAR